ncbi:hypothetical protein HK405_010294, partial [Cladochytrium tenue]
MWDQVDVVVVPPSPLSLAPPPTTTAATAAAAAVKPDADAALASVLDRLLAGARSYLACAAASPATRVPPSIRRIRSGKQPQHMCPAARRKRLRAVVSWSRSRLRLVGMAEGSPLPYNELENLGVSGIALASTDISRILPHYRLKLVVFLYDGEGAPGNLRYKDADGASVNLSATVADAVKAEPHAAFRRLDVDFIRVLSSSELATLQTPRNIRHIELEPRVRVSVYHVPLDGLGVVARSLAKIHFHLAKLTVRKTLESTAMPLTFMFPVGESHGYFVDDFDARADCLWTDGVAITRDVASVMDPVKEEDPAARAAGVRCSHTLTLIPEMRHLLQADAHRTVATISIRRLNQGESGKDVSTEYSIKMAQGKFTLDCWNQLSAPAATPLASDAVKTENAQLMGSGEVTVKAEHGGILPEGTAAPELDALMAPFMAATTAPTVAPEDFKRILMRRDTQILRVIDICVKDNSADFFPGRTAEDRASLYASLVAATIHRSAAAALRSREHAELERLVREVFASAIPKARRPGRTALVHRRSAELTAARVASARRGPAAAAAAAAKASAAAGLPERRLTSYLYVAPPPQPPNPRTAAVTATAAATAVSSVADGDDELWALADDGVVSAATATAATAAATGPPAMTVSTATGVTAAATAATAAPAA